MSTPTEPTESNILASAIASCLEQPNNLDIDAVSVPDNIETADAFLEWVKDTNNY